MEILEKMQQDYKNRRFDTMLEGCKLSDYGFTPQYSGLNLIIPKNARSLIFPQFKFLLYAQDFDASKKVEIPGNISGGFPINNSVLNLTYVFECPRSFITRDGRIYVTEQAFDYLRDDYFEGLVPGILEDCKRIFEDGLTPEEVEERYPL